MDIRAELDSLKTLIIDRASEAVRMRDLPGVGLLGALANECDSLQTEVSSLERRVAAMKASLNGSPSSPPPAPVALSVGSGPATSPKAAGAQARSRWVAALRERGITLNGYGKRYQATSGHAVAVAFANELPELDDRWFLGLADEHTDVAVLLCRSLGQALYDFILPVHELRTVWRLLSRHRGQIKFNIRKSGNRFSLLIPGSEPVDITKYLGNHDPLRGL